MTTTQRGLAYSADVPKPPRPRAPFLRVEGWGPFGPKSAKALAKLTKKPLVIGQDDFVRYLNDIVRGYMAQSAMHAAGTDAEYQRYAQSIAKHAHALISLLYAVPIGEGPPEIISPITQDALLHMGKPDLGTVSLPSIGLSDDLREVIDQTARGVWVIHQAAQNAAKQWREEIDTKSRTNPGRPHVKYIVGQLAGLFAESFGVVLPTRPHPSSPVTKFCIVVAHALHRRLLRLRKISTTNAAGDSNAVDELRHLTDEKAADYLRRIQKDGGLKRKLTAA